MRIGFATVYDARDVRNWSGTGYHIARALERQGVEIVHLGPLRHRIGPADVAAHLWQRWVRRRNDHPHRMPGMLRGYARQVERKLENADVDVIVGAGVLPLVHLHTAHPVVIWTDCTFAGMIDYYPKFSNLSERTLRQGNAAEKLALSKAAAAIFACQWAADSAVSDYGVGPAKTFVVPFGANLSDGVAPDDVPDIVRARDRECIRLLFIGVDWERKGGNVALEAAKHLNARGLPTELLIVGCEPDVNEKLPEYVKNIGFLSKWDPKDVKRLHELLLTSHFLIVPTKAECFGVVFAEAAAHAVPSLSTRTGGVGSAIRDGVSGRLFDVRSGGREYADFIEQTVRDPETYDRLALSSHEEFRRHLNWDVAGRRVVEILDRVV